MRFSDQDWQPNAVTPLASVCAGASSDARWRDVPRTVWVIDTLARRRLQQAAQDKRHHQQTRELEENRG